MLIQSVVEFGPGTRWRRGAQPVATRGQGVMRDFFRPSSKAHFLHIYYRCLPFVLLGHQGFLWEVQYRWESDG